MAKFDTRNKFEYGAALSATLSGTTKASGDWIDMQGFQSLTFIASTGVVTDAGTAAGFSFQVEEGDDTTDAGATAVADGDLIGAESGLTVTADGDDHKLVGSIGYRGDKRYVRMTATGTTGTNAAVTVMAVKGHGSTQLGASIDGGTAAT